jgi:hypothetical protein
MVKMIIEGNAIVRHQVEIEVPQGSPVSPILFSIFTLELIDWVKECIAAEGLSFVVDFGWVATGLNDNEVVMALERCTAKSIEWANR